jgi:fructoselysine-6-P-deglycase FrlB-like protein
VSEIAREIASQPACWRRAATLAPKFAAALPAHGERVVAVGCGTSLYVARGYASLREAGNNGETDAFAASEFPLGRRYDRLVAITRSGTTTEVVRLLEGAGDLPQSVVITADRRSPAAALATASIVLDFAEERSVVQTRFATTVLALLRAHLDEDLAGLVAEGERALGEPLLEGWSRRKHFVFLGHGWSVGVAEEAALKLREAAQVHTEAYPAMEYRHGPISLAGPGSLVWILGSPDAAIAEDVAATGAAVRVASLDPLAELVLVQRLAVWLAESRGRDPDHPPHLNRSVVLTGPRPISEEGSSVRT